MSFDFSDYKVREEAVTLPDGKKFTLREPSGAAEIAYRKELFGSTTVSDSGQIEFVKALADAEPTLVSLCLFADDGSHPPVEYVATIPNTVFKKLVKWCKENGELEGSSTGPKDGLKPSVGGST